MGECSYYLAARFKDEGAATEGRTRLEKILHGLEEADLKGSSRRSSAKAGKDLALVLDALGLGPDTTEAQLASAVEGVPGADDTQYEIKGPVLRIYAHQVWHLADWTWMEKLVTKLGATNVNWTNEEHLNPFDGIKV
jgi:hypothetical protein